MRTRLLKAFALFVVLLLASACTGQPGHAPKTEAGPQLQDTTDVINFLRTTTSFDFEPAASPEALRLDSDVAVLGRITSVESALVDRPGEPRGAVLISLQVDEVWKASDANPSPATLTYLVNRPNNVPVDGYRKALAEGTRVALFGYKMTDELVKGDAGTGVYEPAAQGLLIEVDHSKAVNVWGDEVSDTDWKGINSIDDLRASLQLSGS